MTFFQQTCVVSRAAMTRWYNGRSFLEVTRGFTFDKESAGDQKKASVHRLSHGVHGDSRRDRRRLFGHLRPWLVVDRRPRGLRCVRCLPTQFVAAVRRFGERRHAACALPGGVPRSGRARRDQRLRAGGHGGNGGRALLRARRLRPRRHRPRGVRQPLRLAQGGSVHHHAAVRAQHHPRRRDDRYLVQAQGARDVPLRQDGGAVLQERDPAHVPQHHQLRIGRLRHPGRIAALLLEERERSDAGRSGHAHRHSPVADVQQPDRP